MERGEAEAGWAPWNVGRNGDDVAAGAGMRGGVVRWNVGGGKGSGERARKG